MCEKYDARTSHKNSKIQNMFAKQNRKFPKVNLKRLKNSSQASTLQFVYKFVNI